MTPPLILLDPPHGNMIPRARRQLPCAPNRASSRPHMQAPGAHPSLGGQVICKLPYWLQVGDMVTVGDNAGLLMHGEIAPCIMRRRGLTGAHAGLARLSSSRTSTLVYAWCKSTTILPFWGKIVYFCHRCGLHRSSWHAWSRFHRDLAKGCV